MSSNVIFVHALKTGGTTVNAAMKNSAWQTKPDFFYRHILGESGETNIGNLFNPEYSEKYRKYKVLTMVRHPVDRVISEYYFLKEREVFMRHLHNKPKNFEEYIRSTQTANGMLNFFSGRKLFSTKMIRKSDLDSVLQAINNVPIHVGIFEQFEKSLGYFSQVAEIKWKREIEVKRITFRRPKVSDLSNNLLELIEEKNALDLDLYNYCVKSFHQKTQHLKAVKIKFIKDKYNHIIPYCARFNLFEFCMENKRYLKNHFKYFKDLNFHLLNSIGLTTGRDFVSTWNRSFVNAINDAYPSNPFNECINSVFTNDLDDPLEDTIRIAKAVDEFFRKEKSQAGRYMTGLVFKENLVEVVRHKKSFLSLLFNN